MSVKLLHFLDPGHGWDRESPGNGTKAKQWPLECLQIDIDI